MINFIKKYFKKSEDFSLKPPYVCPYCKKELDFIPTRSRKCDKCGRKIFIKYSPDNKQKRLVTEKTAARIDREWGALSESNFYESRKDSLFGLAQILKHDNADPEQIYKLLRQFHLEKLQEYKNGGIIERVKIMAMEDENTCHHCLTTNGMILDLDMAIKEMPVPHRDCINLNDGDNTGLICRCLYVPEID